MLALVQDMKSSRSWTMMQKWQEYTKCPKDKSVQAMPKNVCEAGFYEQGKDFCVR